MDTNRLIRFTVAGWAFMLALLLHLWSLGFDFMSVMPSPDLPQSLPQALAYLVVGLASGPIIGLVISTFVHGIIARYMNGDPEFDVPESQESFEKYIAALRKLLKGNRGQKSLFAFVTPSTSDLQLPRRKRKNKADEIKPFFNVLFHGRAPTTLIEYTTRRWTMYWMYVNSIFAVLLSWLPAIRYSWGFSSRPFDPTRLAVEGLIGLFVILGYRRLGSIRKDIREVAWLWLYSEANEWNSNKLKQKTDKGRARS